MKNIFSKLITLFKVNKYYNKDKIKKLKEMKKITFITTNKIPRKAKSFKTNDELFEFLKKNPNIKNINIILNNEEIILHYDKI